MASQDEKRELVRAKTVRSVQVSAYELMPNKCERERHEESKRLRQITRQTTENKKKIETEPKEEKQ